MAEITEGYSATVAPQIIGNKVIVGISWGDFGVRSFVDAYDVNTGKRIWRFWTVPGPDEKGSETWEGESWKNGGGPVWMRPTTALWSSTIWNG